MPRKIPKKKEAARSAFDRTQRYSVEEAIQLVKKAKYAKFDETVDLAVRLGVNPRHADQMVRGAIVLPHGIGKDVRVVVFAKGEKEKEAEEAGADFVGAEDLVEKIQGGWLEFDTAIAMPPMMGQALRPADETRLGLHFRNCLRQYLHYRHPAGLFANRQLTNHIA